MTEKRSKRAKFTKEYKVEACKLVTERGLRVSQAAKDLGIDEVTLGDEFSLHADMLVLSFAAFLQTVAPFCSL